MLADAAGLRDIAKGAVPVVAEQLIGQRRVVARMAVRAHGLAAGNFFAGVPLHVVHHQQVQVAIVVHVKPASPHGPELLGALQPRRSRYVLELAVAQIAVEPVAIDAGDKEVRVSIVVEISAGHPHVEALPGNPRTGGHVGKTKVAQIPVEPVPIAGLGLAQGGLRRAVYEVEVLPAIAIKVQKWPRRAWFQSNA